MIIMCNSCPFRNEIQRYEDDGIRYRVSIECEYVPVCQRAYVKGLKLNNKLLDTKIEDLILDSEMQGMLGTKEMLKRYKRMGCKNLKNVLEQLNRENDICRTKIRTMEEAIWKWGIQKEHNSK